MKKEIAFNTVTQQESNRDAYDEKRDTVKALFGERSSWRKLSRLVAWCRRVKKRQSGPLSVDELEAAERWMVLQMQRASFPRTMQDIAGGKQLGGTSAVAHLRPFLDGRGMLRTDSRLRDAANLEYEEKFQLLLPKDHPLLPLLIRKAHEELKHAGPQHVTTHLRKNYWILQGTGVVRKVVRECIMCKRQRAKPQQQQMAPLPDFRFPDERVDPFSATAVDAAGPFRVGNDKKDSKKAYFVLFTCLAYRAIHLEPIFSMTSTSFLRALDRFTARRGVPEKIVSDNGTNFTAAAAELKQLWSAQAKKEYQEKRPEIQWQFLPPYAPHFGGAHERLIAAVKKALYHTFRPGQVIAVEDFVTALAVVEGILNSRPLTYLTSNEDAINPLTPADFLNTKAYRQVATLPEGTSRQSAWRRMQERLDHFWKRFVTEVAPYLQQATKWRLKGRNLQVGDVVVFLEQDKRGIWPLGRIHKTEKSRDGLVRKVEVLSNGTIYKRAIGRVMLLVPAREGDEHDNKEDDA